MAGGKHIGKVVIKIRDEEKELKTTPTPMLFDAEPRVFCQENMSYVIIGGLGGIGMELCDWLILRGARNIVLSSRNGIQTGYQSYRIKLWRSYGVKVIIFTEDVTKEQGVRNLLQIANSTGSVAGIFNLAVILEDGAFSEQTEDSFRIAVGPKADVTIHLDKLSRKMCPKLEYFIVFSSVTCGLGNINQTNYGFANAIAEGICEARHADNLPALAVQWGAIGEVGIVAELSEDNAIAIRGTLQQRIKSCFEILNLFMKQGNPIVTSMVVAQRRHVETDIIDQVANILGIKDLKGISPNWTLPELGMDSILAVEIKQTLEAEFNMYFTPEDLRNTTIAKLYAIKNENEKESTPSTEISMQHQFLLDENILNKLVLRIPFETSGSETFINHKKPSIFIFPGFEGTALLMEPLVKNLNTPAFCFQYLYEKQANSFFQEQSKSFSNFILENLDDDQDFKIIGYSTGGLFAMEVAKILEKSGKKGCIYLIDSSPQYQKMLEIDYFKRITNSNEQSRQNYTCAITMRILCPKLDEKKGIENFEMAGDWEAKKKLCISMLPSGTANENAVLQILDRMFYMLECAPAFQVSPGKIQTPCILIRRSDDKFDLDESYGLPEYFENPVQTHRINADHVSILTNPNTAQIIMQSFQ